jgi:hypothetical protein
LMSGLFIASKMEGAASAIKKTRDKYAGITPKTLISVLVVRIILKINEKENYKLKLIAFILKGKAAIYGSIIGF